MKQAFVVVPLMLGLAAALPPAGADSFYRWVDADGVTHFSDAPPPQAASVVSVRRPNYAPAAADDFYSVVNQSRRLEQARRQREQDRAAQALAAAERTRTLAEADRAAVEARLAEVVRVPALPLQSAAAGYLAPGHAFGQRPLPRLRPGETVLQRSLVQPRFELQYGQRRFIGMERTTVTQSLEGESR